MKFFPTVALYANALAFCATPTTAQVQRVIFADLSASRGADDFARWLEAAEQRTFRPLRFGDRLLIYGVHDHTSESAPLFDIEIPLVTSESGIIGTTTGRKALRHARLAGAEKLREALKADVRSHSTRLVESLRRIPKDPVRKTEVLYLSDMLESTRELDLERTRITPVNLAKLAQGAMDRYQLTRGMLDGATFYCVLDSPPVASTAVKANDHQALGGFWRLLINSLGGRLAAFDSRIQ